MKSVKVGGVLTSKSESHVAFRMDGEVRMMTFVSKKWGNASGEARSIVVGKFGEGKQLRPVVLLVVAVDAEELSEGLVCPFRLSVPFRMVTRGVVELHIESGSEGAEESGNEFGTSIGGDMIRNSMLREYVKYEELS